MTRLYKILCPILVAFVAIWGITSLGKLIQPKGDYVPFTLYSEVVHDFVSLDNSDDRGTQYYDYSGHSYTESEFDSILPSFYARQLVMDGRLPDTICGVPVTQKSLEQQSFIFVSHPNTLNTHTTPLYFLLESMSKRVDLEMPSDVFRFTDNGIEFIDMERNEVDHEKSRLFSDVLKGKGVAFPIKTIAGNTTTRKPYDNGFLFLDNQNQLFQLKQTVGQPYLKQISLPKGIDLQYLFVTEYPDQKYLGFVVDNMGQFFAITLPDYKLLKAELPPAIMATEKMIVFGNPFYWTVIQSQSNGVQYTALDAKSLQQVGSHYFETPRPRSFAYYILPFQISFTAAEHEYFLPAVSSFSPIGLAVWCLLLSLYFVIRRRTNKTI